MKLYRKTYRLLNSDKMSIIFNAKGVARTLYFGGANRYCMVKGFYTTDNIDEQSFLESHPLFNREFVLENAVVIREVEETPAPVVVDAPAAPKFEKKTFKTVKECQDFLQKEHGKKGYLYSSYAKCKAICRELGIEAVFENEN